MEEPVQHQSPKRGRPPKTKSNKASGGEDAGANGAASGKPSRGRPKRVSTELQTEPEISHRSTRARDEESPFPMEMPRKKGRPSKSKAVDANGFLSPEPTQPGTSKIALPFADTPVIRRNKEMREERAGKGQRRSSLGMRGRRASSLIDSGASNGGEILPQKSPSPETERGADAFRTAVPHKEVDTSDFYKHIASEGLSEPRRMKVLLTWCATRAMGDKPSGSRSDDDSARLAGEFAESLKFSVEKTDLFSQPASSRKSCFRTLRTSPNSPTGFHERTQSLLLWLSRNPIRRTFRMPRRSKNSRNKYNGMLQADCELEPLLIGLHFKDYKMKELLSTPSYDLLQFHATILQGRDRHLQNSRQRKQRPSLRLRQYRKVLKPLMHPY